MAEVWEDGADVLALNEACASLKRRMGEAEAAKKEAVK
jgi:hypothetical protein